MVYVKYRGEESYGWWDASPPKSSGAGSASSMTVGVAHKFRKRYLKAESVYKNDHDQQANLINHTK